MWRHYLAIVLVCYLSCTSSTAADPRKLNNENNNNNADAYNPDLSTYTLQFQKCQFRKQYATDCDSYQSGYSCLETKRFAVFRLCPTSSSYGSCNTNYGEYMIDLETFLKATTEYYINVQQTYCQQCNSYCSGNNERSLTSSSSSSSSSSSLCSSCVTPCHTYKQLQQNSQYVDATKYVTCQYISTDSSSGVSYYAGPMCSSNGSKIKIGVFKDDQCTVLVSNTDMDSLLSANNGQTTYLTHIILKKVYTNSCISCGDTTNNENTVCQTLYEYSDKCETPHGFGSSSRSSSSLSSSQLTYEKNICTMISQLVSGAFDQTGEVALTKESGTSSSSALNKGTPNQKFALSVFMFSSIGLALYSTALHYRLTKGGKSLLHAQQEEQEKEQHSEELRVSMGTLA